MTTWERFPKAPIVEALLDVQVKFASPIDLARLEAFHDPIRERYPTKQARVKMEGEIQLKPPAMQQAVKVSPQGFMFKSADGQRIVQVRQDGFTFNWLRPYDRWESLRDEARVHWNRYRDTFRPEEVTRLGLRYINRIELPLPLTDFRDYVKTAPDIAAGMPQGVSALFMRLEIPDNERRLLAIVTETLQPSVDDDTRIPIIFDIDVVRPGKFEPSEPLWETLEQMHEYKNEIFFASMTERAKEMFR